MAPSVIHQPRVAWDAARVFVRAASSRDYEAFAALVADWLGTEHYVELAETRERILMGWLETDGDRHVTDVEMGRWRARLEDLLRARPDLIDAVRELSTF
jgi:hypothetical protein